MPEPTPSAAMVAVARGLKLAMYLEDPCECDEQSVCWDHVHIARALDAERGKVVTEYLLPLLTSAEAFCEEITEDHPAIDPVRLRALNAAIDRAAEVRR